MAKKQPQRPVQRPVTKSNTDIPKSKVADNAKPPFWHSPYFPGIVLFLIAFIVCLFTYQDYGICWDEPFQRSPGLLSYNYAFHGDPALFNSITDNHGAGYELLLVIFEKLAGLTDSRDIYLMRHLVSNVFFLISALFAYVLILRLTKNKIVASLGFIMLVLAPRLYAHSFFNSKDIPFMCMVTITLTVCHIAFEKNRKWLFFLLGIAAGYATSIRIMGVMLYVIILFFLLIDFITTLIKKEKPIAPVINMLLFTVGFCLALYLGWPYLWKHPIQFFMESFTAMSHYDAWKGSVLIYGKFVPASRLPWTYFPVWFLISNPEVWLIAGFAGLIWIIIDFFKKPLVFFQNTPQRNYLIYLICFGGPIFAVIFLHSVIYDDWRHLYFVYPPFILMAIYFIDKMLRTKYKKIVQGVCAAQTAFTVFFMLHNHPFNQVYFNSFVSHSPEYLRKNFEMDYWGCGFKQALEYLVQAKPQGPITVSCENPTSVTNNFLILREEDRNRIQVVDPEKADYFVTNFRGHPYDYPSNKVEYSVSVLNSTILCIFKEEKDPVKQKQMREEEILSLNKALAINPDDASVHARLGEAYLRNDQYDSAEFHHMLALKLDPTSIVINDMAGEYFGKKQYSMAVDFCKKSLEINPNDVNPYTNMGLCYMRLGKFDSAIYCYNRALAIDPKYTLVYQNLAITYKAMGNLDSARKYEAIAEKNRLDVKQ